MARQSRASREAPAKARTNSRLFHRGSEAITRADSELEKQKARREAAAKDRNKPLRFFVPVGDTKEIVVLDDKPDFFLYEHTMKDPVTKKWGKTVVCIGEYDTCPICEHVGDPTYIMFLSVLDLTPFKDSKGVTHDFSRKLMAVKPTQQKKFIRRYEKDGTLRGAIFECSRDGDKDAAIGNDIEYIESMDEEELSQDYIRTWTDRERKTHTENCGEPFDYETLFEEPTVEELEALVGASPPNGSSRQVARDLDDKPARSRRSARDKSPDPEDDDGWDADDSDVPWDDEDEKPAPRRTRAAAKEEEPAPRRRRAAAEPEPETAPKRRRAAPEPEPEPAPRRRRPAPEPEPEPAAPRRTRVARRAAP
jgi:hypothetical protein